MFIQKIFHVHLPLAETKTRLARLDRLSQHLNGLEKAIITADGVGQFACEIEHGLRAHCVLIELPTEDENQVLFQSTTGNIEVSGLVEFLEVKEGLTEVQLTMEYGFNSIFSGLWDRMFRSTERFFQHQVGVLQRQLESGYAFATKRSTAMAQLSSLAH